MAAEHCRRIAAIVDSSRAAVDSSAPAGVLIVMISQCQQSIARLCGATSRTTSTASSAEVNCSNWDSPVRRPGRISATDVGVSCYPGSTQVSPERCHRWHPSGLPCSTPVQGRRPATAPPCGSAMWLTSWSIQSTSASRLRGGCGGRSASTYTSPDGWTTPGLRSCIQARHRPESRLEVALLDQCEYETAEQAAHFVLTAIQRRLTTADRLGRALAPRSRHRWRGLLRQISRAKRKTAWPRRSSCSYRRDRGAPPTDFPAGLRNRRRGLAHRRRQLVPRRALSAMACGRRARRAGGSSRPTERFATDRRDNRAATGAGNASLRYGWRDVVGDPCDGGSPSRRRSLPVGGWQGQPSP